jgi:formate dehydrogenase assembly factor FdhD
MNTGNFILMYSGNESNNCATGFMINRKYIQSIMNVDAMDDNIVTIISVSVATEGKDELDRTAFTIN